MFAFVNLVNAHRKPMGGCTVLPTSQAMITEAQREQVTCPRPHSQSCGKSQPQPSSCRRTDEHAEPRGGNAECTGPVLGKGSGVEF